MAQQKFPPDLTKTSMASSAREIFRNHYRGCLTGSVRLNQCYVARYWFYAKMRNALNKSGWKSFDPYGFTFEFEIPFGLTTPVQDIECKPILWMQ